MSSIPPSGPPPGWPPSPDHGDGPPPGWPPPGASTPPPGWPPPGPSAPPPGYGYQGYGYPQQVEHPQGTTVLVLGLVSLVVCALTGPFAWSMGTKALREIDANPSMYSNRSSVVAGRIMGMITSVLLVLGLLLVVLLVLVAALGSSSSAEFQRVGESVSGF